MCAWCPATRATSLPLCPVFAILVEVTLRAWSNLSVLSSTPSDCVRVVHTDTAASSIAAVQYSSGRRNRSAHKNANRLQRGFSQLASRAPSIQQEAAVGAAGRKPETKQKHLLQSPFQLLLLHGSRKRTSDLIPGGGEKRFDHERRTKSSRTNPKKTSDQ